MIRERIHSAVYGAEDLSAVLERMIKLFAHLKSDHAQLGYVAGIISSDGPEHVERNVKNLAQNAELIGGHCGHPVFSAFDIFYSNGLALTLQEWNLSSRERQEAFIHFWRSILCCGHITDLHMTKRWEESEGARDEHETALAQGINIIYHE